MLGVHKCGDIAHICLFTLLFEVFCATIPPHDPRGKVVPPHNYRSVGNISWGRKQASPASQLGSSHCGGALAADKTVLLPQGSNDVTGWRLLV